MRRHALSLGILFIVGLFLVAAPALHAESGMPTKEWSQGQFALWVVKAAGALSKLPPAATGADAVAFLTKLGLVPEGGWKKDEKIDEAFLSSLLGDEGSGNLNFDQLVTKVQERINSIYQSWSQGYFTATPAGSSTTPTP